MRKILKLNNIECLNNSITKFYATKELIIKKNVENQFDIERYFKEHSIKLKHPSFSILRGLSNYFLKNNKLIE